MVVLTGHNIAIGSTIVDIEKEQGQGRVRRRGIREGSMFGVFMEPK